MKIKTDIERRAELHACIAWAGIWLMMLYALMASAGCSTGGGRICFGYEEVNQIKNSSGYEIPKKEGK